MKNYKQHNKEGKRKCDKCGRVKRTRHVIYHKGKYLCTNCKSKNKTTAMNVQLPIVKSLKEALSKVYQARISFSKDGKYRCNYCYFPRVLAGKKFKVKLVEGD